jgi:hypothetical protein
VVDDLLSLVDAIAAAASDDPDLMRPVVQRGPVSDLPEMVVHLFSKPVVAIHPGAGNTTKEWPISHFSDLIDLLVAKNDVNVIIVGGPDERNLAEALRDDLLRPEAVVSVAGLTRMSDLPSLLAACALYIGNDSGPKHIAAACGIPTIGIHSGVVDATEWGPIGRRAVALRRNMSCSPCYLANAADCPRNLACLRFLDPALVYQTALSMLGRPVTQPRPSAEIVPGLAASQEPGHDLPLKPQASSGRAAKRTPAGTKLPAKSRQRRATQAADG